MTLLNKEVFICLDIEATGLDPENDRIIEIAAARFTLKEISETFSSLVDPIIQIPKISQAIHNISQDMVRGKPKIKKILPEVLKFIEGHVIIGHGINYDIDIIYHEAKRSNIEFNIKNIKSIDTLRLARLYGKSKTNSLQSLSKHFNVALEGAHRALNDVKANIEIFKHLIQPFSTTLELLKLLEKPIRLKRMPLGKHKGRGFAEIPVEYLRWAASKDFDQDLLYSIRKEIKTRKEKTSFEQASNPFYGL